MDWQVRSISSFLDHRRSYVAPTHPKTHKKLLFPFVIVLLCGFATLIRTAYKILKKSRERQPSTLY